MTDQPPMLIVKSDNIARQIEKLPPRLNLIPVRNDWLHALATNSDIEGLALAFEQICHDKCISSHVLDTALFIFRNLKSTISLYHPDIRQNAFLEYLIDV